MSKKGILERLSEGLVIGDGGFTWGLEKRGYVRVGPWTPECVVKHSDAVKQYHREFLRCGSDVMQAYTFYGSDDKLQHAEEKSGKETASISEQINMTACRIAREVANEGDALICASLSQMPGFKEGKGKEYVQNEFRKQLQYFVKSDVDFVVCEYFDQIQELEWAIEVAKESKKPVAATMCIGSQYDQAGVPTGECGVRMAKAGADIIGINCNFGPQNCLNSVKVMKKALDKEGLHPYLMVQPLIFHTPEIDTKEGYIRLPDCPFNLEPRTATRYEIAKWARECYNAGIRYIGGCCGFEPYHIRAISEELCKERGRKCMVTEEQGFVIDGLKASMFSLYHRRGSEKYWTSRTPCTGRPYSTAYAEIDVD